MSLWKWLSSKLTGKPPRRDVSRLESEDEDQVSEAVDVSGGPLKPDHRRRALRDRRLLPKAQPPVRFGKKKRLMSKAEAQRLFGASMRTRNRTLRDLLPDVEQLTRYGLPVWKTEEELATALGLTQRQLWFFALHREKERAAHYVTFAIPKRGGGERHIMAPKRRLKALQRKLLGLLVEKLPVHEAAHGFRKGRSIKSGAALHVGKKLVLKVDLKDFFPTVTFPRVRGLLIAYGYGYPVATALALLMTESVRQPVEVEGKLYHVPVGPRHSVQGAPTSPGLSNALVLRMDRRLTGLARKFGFVYTRYADDLAFSGDHDHKTGWGLLQRARRIIAEEGFAVHPDKTVLMGSGRRQSVTGVVVNRTLGRSRQQRRRLRAALHRRRQAEARLRGQLAFLWMLNPAQASALWPEEWKKPQS
ncbi:RNA-directed DNA polymerase [bacterium CPR1]|nr:RNA-directed DNA polymerase [bacterium CPR1]